MLKPYSIEIDIEAGTIRYHYRDKDDEVVSKHDLQARIRDEIAQRSISENGNVREILTGEVDEEINARWADAVQVALTHATKEGV